MFTCAHTFQSDDFTSWIHNCRISRYWSSDRIGGIIHIDNNYLGSVTNLFSNANEFIRFHSKCIKADITGINSHSCKL